MSDTKKKESENNAPAELESYQNVSPVSTIYTDYQGRHAASAHFYVEHQLTEYLRLGQPERITEFLMKLNEKQFPFDIMAESELRSFKNLFISSTAISRHIAIEEGLNPELANSLCDMYVQNVEKMTDFNTIERYFFQMMIDYAKRLRKIKEYKTDNPLVRAVLNDVNARIYEPLSPAILSRHLNYSKEHLCRQFKQITGMTLQHYILQQKTAEAKIMLRHTDYSISEISENLSFHSQSYFQKVFLKYSGMTPMHYRKQCLSSR